MLRLWRRVSEAMDAGDVVYLTGTACVGVGCGLVSLPAGLVAVGALVMLPQLVGLFRRGPQK